MLAPLELAPENSLDCAKLPDSVMLFSVPVPEPGGAMRSSGSSRLRLAPALLAALGIISLVAFPALRAQDDSDRPHLKPQPQSSSSKQQDQQQSQQQQSPPPSSTPAPADSNTKSEATPAQPSARADQPIVPNTLPRGKKLFLTDGSYQLVREYQRQEDRVRYYSVERSAWEEIPASLVDWAATQKAEADDQARDKELTQKIKASELAARTAGIDSDRSYEVRPGVILPDEAGMYVLDGTKVLTLQQDQAVSRMDKGREIARIATGVPLINTKHSVDLPGKRAKLRIRSTEPEFYFRPVDGREPHISLFRLDVNADKRVVETVSTNVADISTSKGHEISLLSWDAAKGLTRFTVEEKLEPGEYAISESRTDGEVDLYLWDFGVDANPGE